MKRTVCILEASVAVEKRVHARIFPDGLVQGFEYQRIVVVLTDLKSNDAPVTEVKDGAEIELVDFYALIPFEFRHVGEPLFVGLFGVKLTVQKIFSEILRSLCLPGTAVICVLDGGLYVPCPADAQDTFVIDVNAPVMSQVVVDAAVALIGTFYMNFLNLVGKLLVLNGPAAELAGSPTVVCRA